MGGHLPHINFSRLIDVDFFTPFDRLVFPWFCATAIMHITHGSVKNTIKISLTSSRSMET